MNAEQLTPPAGLQLACEMLGYIPHAAFDPQVEQAQDAIRAEHAQRVTLQHHAADMAQRIADLEAKCVTIKELHDAAADERDALAQRHRSQHDADSAELRRLCADRDAARKERDELRARLAEIEAQEPVLWAPSCASHEFASGVRGYGQQLTVWFDQPAAEHPGRGHCQTPLFTKPSNAQAVPDADGARFRWLCEDHSDRETREQCRSLIDRLSVMSYSAAVMSIDAAMAEAPEHKA